MIERLVALLDQKRVLDNTYIIFTTDNGFHASQHRMHPGKECGYDTDIHIPLVIRGPRVAAGAKQALVTSHTDVAPTILSIANATLRKDFDGLPIPLSLDDAHNNASFRGEHVNVEFWGIGLPEGKFGIVAPSARLSYPNNTYKALRVVGKTYSLYYSVWCTGEREFYDLQQDAFQMHNLFAEKELADAYVLAGRKWQQVVYRLDALLVVLKTCKGALCTRPWSLHHADDASVTSLLQALAKDFDAYYAAYPKIGFSSCELGYIKEAEGNKERISHAGVEWIDDDDGIAGVDDVAGAGAQQRPFRYKGHWSDWV
jgi:N-acetylglucosamine-6-sulfatase